MAHKLAMGSHANRPTPTDVSHMPGHARSRVTNGKGLFADKSVDQRSGWVRRLRDLLALHITDMGGEEMISAAERSIIRRAATITVELELLEKKFALSNGAKPADLDLYVRCASSLRRLLETIGLKRVARDISPTLSDYLNQRVDEVEIDDAEIIEEVSP